MWLVKKPNMVQIYSILNFEGIEGLEKYEEMKILHDVLHDS